MFGFERDGPEDQQIESAWPKIGMGAQAAPSVIHRRYPVYDAKTLRNVRLMRASPVSACSPPFSGATP